ncbi:MAG: nucleotide sugar dehydrogenase [Coriobacteriia bacterium]|nr:nucleotide sugar dehydrogenase [Coriobacteriia bacterium]
MELKERFADRSAVFGVVGLGYVGLPLATEMAKAGHRVLGLEVSEEKAALVNRGESYIPDVPTPELARLVADGLIEATTDFSRAGACDAVVICVPTPLNKAKEPDVSCITSAAESIAPYLHTNMLVALESTTYPGTTEEVLRPIIERGGGQGKLQDTSTEQDTLTVGESLFLAFSPERVDPGNAVYQTKNTPKLVGGVTPACTEVATAFYESFLDTVVPMSSARAAEMAKLLENIFRCVNIALVNELLMLSERMDIDIWEVVDAAKTKPFGFMPFYPGPGLGGHCIPIDPFYLAWKAREYDFQSEFIELAGRVNENMPYYVVQRLMEALNAEGKALSISRVLILGVAYKADIGDMRKSPAIRISELLLAKGADLVYHDPHVPEFDAGGKRLSSLELTREEVAAADAVLILTAHTSVNHRMVAENARMVLDTRNALRGIECDRVVRL